MIDRNHSHQTRRSVLKFGLAATAGAALTPFSARAATGDDLITKAIPSSGEKIPVIGLGTNAYGVNDAEGLAARQEVLANIPKLGLSVVDTAPSYGKSEEVLGNLITKIGNRDKLFLATKVTVDDGDVKKGIAMIEESFKKLQTDRIDLLQVHSMRGTEVLLPVLRELKEEGRIRYYGVTTSDSREYEKLIKALKNEKLDFMQVDYSIANREVEETILPLAADKGIATLLNFPFGGRRSDNVIAKSVGKKLPDFAAEIQCTTWPQILLKYLVSHPSVTCAIPGTVKLKHLEDNAKAARGVLPDADLRKRIEKAFAAL